jgi:hypothetical protein
MHHREDARTMNSFSDLGRLLLVVGGAIVLLGLLLLLAGRLPFLGRLPGDINIHRGNTSVFIPIASCLLLSIVLTVVVNLLLFLFRRH